ncbi:hypothetical protein ABVT39_000726 [Epinephelus coioides]
MASSVKYERPEREESCFSRAARSIRRALSRICGDSSHSSSVDTRPRPIPQPDYEELDVSCGSDTVYDQSDTDYVPPRPHRGVVKGLSGFSFSGSLTNFVHLHFPPSQRSSFIQKSQKRTSSAPSFRSKKKHKTDSLHMTSTTDRFDCMLDQPPSGTLRETGVKKHGSSAGLNQDNTREMELNATAGPSILQFTISDDDDSDSAVVYDREKEWDESSGSLWFGGADRKTCKYRHARIRSPPLSDPYLHLPNKKDTHDEPRLSCPAYLLSDPSCCCPSMSTGHTHSPP